MGVIRSIWKAITSPIGVLEDWAKEPLHRWENKRREDSKDRDVERHIKEQVGVEEAKTRLKMEYDRNQTELEIRMQTEVNRLNAEREQWAKDKEFERMKKVADAVAEYQERLTNLNITTVRAIGEMDIELRAKAQNLILEKTHQYRQIQDKASAAAEEEFERILQKFSSNERVLGIMIANSERKLVGIIDATTKFLDELSVDIQNMNANIDHLISIGHEHTLRQLDRFGSMNYPRVESMQNNSQDTPYKEIN